MTIRNFHFSTAMALAASLLFFSNCKKEVASDAASIQFKFKFDATQARLNNIGQPSAIPSGNAAQTPEFHEMSVHYIR